MFFLFSGVGCRVKYSLSGASIHPDAKTVSIPFFPNNAPLVSATLSSTFTDALQEKFANQTKLTQVPEDGDLSFSGEIIGYTSTPTAITASEEYPSAQNRLTITVRVRFTNRLEPQWDFDRTFSHYEDYDSNTPLSSLESQLNATIVKVLVQDIYDASVANW